MRNIYVDYLFAQGYLVYDERYSTGHPGEALVALAHFAAIRVTARPELATPEMVRTAARCIGKDVPEPFYLGFPESVRALTPNDLAFDQFLHYLRTYGFGDFSEPGHSVLEGWAALYERAAFAEDVQPKDFAIVTEAEAEALLLRAVEGFLASTRPLNDANYDLLLSYVRDYNYAVRACASKDTACRLVLSLRNPALFELVDLPSVIRLLEWLLEQSYPEMSLTKLNLRNRDRKLITAVLDAAFARGGAGAGACLEQRRKWAGLLHHLHYQPKCAEAESFCHGIRAHEPRSAYAAFEAALAAGDVREACDVLRTRKGAGAVQRHLTHLLSRCTNDEDAAYVLEAARTRNKILLVQQLINYSSSAPDAARNFTFVRLNKLSKHTETEVEQQRRKNVLTSEQQRQAREFVREQLAQACHGTLGKVYAAPEFARVALPLQEAASQGGFGTLSRGTRVPLPQGKVLRAFTYWEKVSDIDLSCFGITEAGEVQEFSWRTMSGYDAADLGAMQSEAITFSGDQTSGYRGGSEYFDVNLPAFRERYPHVRYLLFCNNIFTNCEDGEPTSFARCTCRAGYMLRDEVSSGEVFEPKTVASSFTINCASREAFLFALDLHASEFVWLNLANNSKRAIAGEGDLRFLLDYLGVTKVMNLELFAQLLASEVVATPEEADVVFSDAELELRPGQGQIRSRDTARLLELLNS